MHVVDVAFVNNIRHVVRAKHKKLIVGLKNLGPGVEFESDFDPYKPYPGCAVVFDCSASTLPRVNVR